MPFVMDIISDDMAALGIRVSSAGRVVYPDNYSVYAARFETSPRTVRSWVAAGRKKGQVPPLPDAAAMIVWWTGFMKNRPPESFIKLSRNDLGTEKNSGNNEIEGGGRAAKASCLEKPDNSMIRAGGNELEGATEALRQCREMANEAYIALIRAQRAGDPGEVEMWRKAWAEFVETQRKWEKDFNRIQEDRGLLVRKSETVVEVAAVANVLRRAFLSAMENLLEKHCPQMPQDIRRKSAVKERDRCFEILQSSQFKLLN